MDWLFFHIYIQNYIPELPHKNNKKFNKIFTKKKEFYTPMYNIYISINIWEDYLYGNWN